MSVRRITYTTASGATSQGTTFDLLCDTAAIDSRELLGWGWSVDSSTNRPTRDARQYGAVVAFMAGPGRDARAVANEFTRLCDRDLESSREGVLRVGEWELPCAVVEAKCAAMTDAAVVYQLSLRAREPVWRRVTKVSLKESQSGEVGADGLDHEHDFPFDYAGAVVATPVSSVECDSLARLTFWGPCTDPYVRVTSEWLGGRQTNTYGVDAACRAGERIVIDPLGRGTVGGSVYKVDLYGQRTNLFDRRRRGAEGSGTNPFEVMRAGSVTLTWPRTFGVDVELVERRGQLPWT